MLRLFSNLKSARNHISKDRPNQEFGQAVIRIVLGSIIFGYLLYTIFIDVNVSTSDRNTLIVADTFFLFAFTIIIWIMIDPGIRIIRRILGIIVDTGATTAALFFHGILAAPVFIIYLWVIFAMVFVLA